MPLDPGMGTREISRSPKKKKVAPPVRPGLSGDLPAEKPVIPLQKYGVQSGITEVNDKVEKAVAAHTRAFGKPPSAGLMFDLLRSPTQIDYDELFHLPRNARQAEHFKIAKTVQSGLDDMNMELSDLDVVKRGIVAVAEGRGPDNNDRLVAAFVRNPKLRTMYNEQTIKIRMYQTSAQMAGVAPLGKLQGVGEVGALGARQIAQGLSDTPYGIYLMGKAVGTDVKNARGIVAGKKAPETGKIAVEMGKQIYNDFRHPLDNPGYLAMDIWGAVSGGSGMVARLRAGGKAAGTLHAPMWDQVVGDVMGKKPSKVGTFVKTAAKRPVGGSFELGWEGHNASVPLFDNTAARVIQKALLEKRQKRMVERQSGRFTDDHSWLVDELFSTERKLAREKRVNAEIKFGVQVSPLVELNKMIRWQARAAAVTKQVLHHPTQIASFNKLAKRERIGLEKLAQVLMTDDPTPMLTWERFHDRKIAEAARGLQLLKGDETLHPTTALKRKEALEHQFNSHKIQKEALVLAKEVFENPSKRVQPFIDQIRKVSVAQEGVKKTVMGLSDEIAGQAIGLTAARLRGEHIIDLGEGIRGSTFADPAPAQAIVAKREARLVRLNQELSKVNATLRLHPANADALANKVKLDAKIAKANTSLGRAQAPLEALRAAAVPIQQIMEDSAYLPTTRDIHRTQKLSGIPGGARKSQFGVRPPTKPPSLRYRNDGLAIEIGDFSWDTSALLSDEFLRTLKSAYAITQYQDLWSMASKEIISEKYSHPIRNTATVPERLKKVVTAMEGRTISSDAAALLDEPALAELRAWATPSIDDMNAMIKSGEAKKSEFRFVDERFMFDRVGGRDVHFWQNMDSVIGGAMTPINEPMRLMQIFLTPAYALNAGGNMMMALVKQGPFAIPNTRRGMVANRLYTREGADIIDALGGETLSSSLVTEKNMFTKGSQAIMKVWQTVTDQAFRRGAVIHELQRRGVLKKDMTPTQALDALKSPEFEQARTEAARAARQSMLDFNRLSWPEKATLRHFVFIYSFMRASFVYGARFMVEHPIQNAVYSQAGRGREEDLTELLGEQPEWFLRHGYFPGPDGMVIDPIQFNVQAMLTETAYPIASLFADVPYSSPSELESPSLKLFGRLATGHDEQGKELEGPGGRIGKSFLSILSETPIPYALKRGAREKQERPLPDPAIESGYLDPVNAAMGRENAALKHGSFEGDGFMNTWGRVIGRSAVPLDIEKEALNARYWRDLRDTNPEKFVQHQIDKVNEMVTRQEKVVGASAPQEVRDAVDLVSKIAISIETWRKDLRDGNDVKIKVPTHKQVALETIDILTEMGRVDEAEAKEMRKQVMAARTPKEALQERMAILNKYAGAWKTWNDRVNKINWFAGVEFGAALEDGRKEGLGDFTRATKASKPAKWEYGRRYLQYADDYKQQQERVRSLDGTAGAAADAEFKLWLYDHDKPVSIKGASFPSPLRTEFMKKNPEQWATAIRSIATKGWASLDHFEREIVGKPVKKEVMEGWLALNQILDQEEQARPLGESAPDGRKKQLALWIGGKIPAFMLDYQFSERPLAGRMMDLKPIRTSPNSSDWNEMLGAAAKWQKQWVDAGYNKSQISDNWKRNYAPKIRAWVATRPQAFQDEVNAYAQKVDEDDGSVTNTNFIESLVSG